jgi:hypothetical protein
VTRVFDTTWEDNPTDTLVALYAKIFGNKTFDAVSMGNVLASHDENPTEKLAILCEAEFVKPLIVQDIGNDPEDNATIPDNLMTRKGSVVE